MNIKHLRVFKEVCKQESVSNAAKILYMAQPAVSLSIKELEQYYEVKLFDRISRKMIITEKGKELLEYTNMILDMFDEVEDKIRNDNYSSNIRLGSSVTFANYFLFDLISYIKDDYPEMKTDVIVDSSMNIEEMIVNNELDMGIVEGSVHHDSLESVVIYQDELVFVGAKNSVASLNLEDLNNQSFLLRNKGSAHREIFDGLVEQHNLKVNILMESIDTNAIINGCIKNLGIALLPYKFVEEYLDNELQIIRINDLNLIKRSYYLIYHQKKHLNLIMTIFKDYIINRKY